MELVVVLLFSTVRAAVVVVPVFPTFDDTLSHIFSDRVLVGPVCLCPRTLVRFRFLPILFVSSVVDRLMWWLFSASVCLNVTFVAADVATRFCTSDWLSMAAQFL